MKKPKLVQRKIWRDKMNIKNLHDCSCGCKMFVYSHGMGPYVNLSTETSTFIRWGIRGNHSKNCIFFNSQLNDKYETADEAVSAWNKIFE